MGRSSYNIPCPVCDHAGSRKRHLNINLKRNVFRCPKCGQFEGGVFLGRLDRTGFHLKSRKLVERHGAFLGVAALHRRPVFTLKTGLKTCYPSPINTDFTKWPRGQCCPFCGKKIMRREAFASFRI